MPWKVPVLALLAAFLATIVSPSRAQDAGEAIRRYMAATVVGCHDFTTRRTKRCPLSKDGVIAGQGEGTFPGDNRKVLFAIFAYPNEGGGNSYQQFGAVFVEENGQYRFVRRVDEIYGSNFRHFGFFSGGKIQVTATVQTANDPRCCPTGTDIVTLDMGGLPGEAGASLPARSNGGGGVPVWTYGRHPALGLSAHVVLGNEAFGVSCLRAPPGSTAVASARMTQGLLPGSSEWMAVFFDGPANVGGSGRLFQPGPAGLLEKSGGYCSLSMDWLVKSSTMTLLRTDNIVAISSDPAVEQVIQQGGKTFTIRSPRDMDALNVVTVPLAGAKDAIAKLMRACPGIARMQDQDCTGGD